MQSCSQTTSLSFQNLSGCKYLIICASRVRLGNPDVDENNMLYLKSYSGCTIESNSKIMGNTNALIVILKDLQDDISIIFNTYGTENVQLCYFTVS